MRAWHVDWEFVGLARRSGFERFRSSLLRCTDDVLAKIAPLYSIIISMCIREENEVEVISHVTRLVPAARPNVDLPAR